MGDFRSCRNDKEFIGFFMKHSFIGFIQGSRLVCWIIRCVFLWISACTVFMLFRTLEGHQIGGLKMTIYKVTAEFFGSEVSIVLEDFETGQNCTCKSYLLQKKGKLLDKFNNCSWIDKSQVVKVVLMQISSHDWVLSLKLKLNNFY